MSEVHPDFRGMTLDKWRMLKITEQCDERQSLPAPVDNQFWIDSERPAIKRAGFGKGRVATARDDYGIKGVR